MKLLNNEQINDFMLNNTGWILNGEKLTRDFTLNSFTDSLTFVVKVGIEAEKLDHHPDILLHSWNKVRIILTTHSESGITDLDIKLANQIEILTK
jgi:4a-hydroxytetrahydrobiopterin dehydratase